MGNQTIEQKALEVDEYIVDIKNELIAKGFDMDDVPLSEFANKVAEIRAYHQIPETFVLPFANDVDFQESRYIAGYCQWGKYLYTVAGQNGPSGGYDNKCLRIDLETDEVTSLPDYPSAISYNSACTDGEYIYSTGGYYGSITKLAYRYKLDGGVAWESMPDVPITSSSTGIWGHNSVVYDGKIFVFNGTISSSSSGAKNLHIFSYDISNGLTGTWQTAGSLPQARMNGGACQLGSKVYIIGSFPISNDLRVLDLDDMSYNTLASMPVSANYPYILPIDEYRLYVRVDFTSAAGNHGQYMYHIPSNTFHTLADNNVHIHYAGAAAFHNNQVVICGGSSGVKNTWITKYDYKGFIRLGRTSIGAIVYLTGSGMLSDGTLIPTKTETTDFDGAYDIFPITDQPPGGWTQ